MPVPILITSLILIALCTALVVIYFLKTGKKVNLGARGINIAVFILSLLSLLISFKLFWNIGVYADEYGSSPTLVCGGWFWLLMDWVRLGLLVVLCVISGLKLLKRSESIQ